MVIWKTISQPLGPMVHANGGTGSQTGDEAAGMRGGFNGIAEPTPVWHCHASGARQDGRLISQLRQAGHRAGELGAATGWKWNIPVCYVFWRQIETMLWLPKPDAAFSRLETGAFDAIKPAARHLAVLEDRQNARCYSESHYLSCF